MNIYVAAIWAVVGLAVALLGSVMWKKNLFNLTLCLNKDKLSDKEKFTEVYSKNVSFLGTMTLMSSIIGFGDDRYLPVAFAINILAIIFFVCEVFRLSKKFML